MKRFVPMLAVLLAGCGGVSEVDSRQPATLPPAVAIITLEMGEEGHLAFNPSSLALKQGDSVEVVLVNKDTVQAHSFVLPVLNLKSKQVPPGKTEKVHLTVPAPGTFKFFCDMPGHKEAGMAGSMTVEP